MSRPPNHEFQEWWNKQRENHHDLFLPHKSQNPTWLIVDIQSPTVDRFIHKDDQARTAHLHFHQLANFFAYLTNGFISLLRTANRRITAASGTSLMYRAIKAFLIVVVLLLMFEELVAAYFKRWYFSPPSAAEVVDVYANWLEISEKYLAPALQSLTNVCVVLFLVQSLNRVLGCFCIKFRRVKPVAAVEDYPMVLVQIPRCNEREVAEAEDDPNTKRCKSTEANGSENGSVKTEEEMQGNATEAGDETKANPKPPEPPKDCIHVRARRGQATDSHSLAERVRREKISERMKLLQDLVPGCNKVTGKALMLDEIINYVQSLQRQVEFLSMKLASVNPRLDSNMDTLLPKDAISNNVQNPNCNT